MINRVLRRIKFLSLQSRISSFSRFKEVARFNQHDVKIVEQNKEMLRPYYEYYVEKISLANMAASLELAAFMYTFCALNHPAKLLDMGSGFSSFVFRLYAKENPNARVFSVDDDAIWLEKTKNFLKSRQMDTGDFFMLDQFLKSTETEFDCILLDLNFVEVRIDYVERMLEIAKSNGVIIFDDVHKPDYLFALLKKLRDRVSKVYDLRPITLDQYGRFALAVVKN